MNLYTLYDPLKIIISPAGGATFVLIYIFETGQSFDNPHLYIDCTFAIMSLRTYETTSYVTFSFSSIYLFRTADAASGIKSDDFILRPYALW